MKKLQVKKACVLSTEAGYVSRETGKEHDLDPYNDLFDNKEDALSFMQDNDLDDSFCYPAGGFLLLSEAGDPLTFVEAGDYQGETLIGDLNEFL